MRIEAESARLRYVLPEATAHSRHYVPAVRMGAAFFLSGHRPRPDPQAQFTGKVGRDPTVGQGYEAARVAALNCLGTIRRIVDNLDLVERIVKSDSSTQLKDSDSRHASTTVLPICLRPSTASMRRMHAPPSA
jgi:enamine deaminase RidA (YjgF/YER057c/UK114 family)